MDHCFLFTKHLNDKGCFCLKISQEGELIAAPAQRNFAEIKTLQKECTTLIIETTASSSILDLELPWLPERKARVAIPYALEDKVAQSVEELHFAFDKLRYQNNHYVVAVISKQRIQYLMHLLDEQNIEFDLITLDWFALSSQELCISESTLLINNDDFKGALSGELARSYIKKHPLNEPLFFQDSEITVDNSLPKSNDFSYTWMAQKILKTKPMNLCQGEMLHGNTSGWTQKGYQLAGALCGIWLLSLLLVNALSLHFLNKKTDAIDQQIATIYHEFFPEAKQVISPKFRISQLLGSNASDAQTHFWFLLNQFAKVMNENQTTIEELRYQNKTLSVTLISSDFASLEDIENKLKKLQLKVKQTQASTRDQHVVATLELT
ncbi:type II secretion system protein GspL [Legionella maioricensis]|uniref:Type II secretion system protein L n=1 Tax=Legionella maioricensis TaxID=2896528 RepID=A0A9X2CXH0_9GAMM|nr:type II secretion system protein GspL [Legionella maioricensis]MCL9682603.1 type II secretion system protein GspL [Legionella maioricensis]MCL9686150.1 type II secretion system protein GspL [Legionella maioricensis]